MRDPLATLQAWQQIMPSRRTWHDRIAAVLYRYGQPRIELVGFPASELQAVVRSHLGELHINPLSRHAEVYLLDGIRSQTFTDPALRFASVLASLPFVSGAVGRDLLRFGINPSNAAGDPLSVGGHGRRQQLGHHAGPMKLSATAICLARAANPAVVAEAEQLCASHLLRYTGDSCAEHGQWIRNFLRLWFCLPVHHLLVHSNIEVLFQNACTRYMDQLEQCEVESRYHEARSASKWLVPFLNDQDPDSRAEERQLSLWSAGSSTTGSNSTELVNDIFDFLGYRAADTHVFELHGNSRPDPGPMNRVNVNQLHNQHPAVLRPERPRPNHIVRRRPVPQAEPRETELPTRTRGAQTDSSVRTYSQILNKYMPKWRSWASWDPDVGRIERWSKLRASDRAALHNLLALQGRDRSQHGSKTIFHRQLAQNQDTNQPIAYGDLVLDCPVTEAEELLMRLYDALDAAQILGDKGLDIYLSLSSSESAVIVPDLFEAMPQDTYNDLALEGLVNVINGLTTIAQLEPLSALLEALCNNLELCDMLRPMLLKSIHATFTEAQDVFTSQIQRDRVGDRLGSSFHRFVTALNGNCWLSEQYEPNIQLILRVLPACETLERVFDYRSSVEHRRAYELRTDPTSGWLLSRFRGESSQFDMPDGVMDALTSAWKEKLSSDCQNIALALLRTSNVDFDIMSACLRDLPKMPSWFARKWLPVFTSSARFPFVQMAKVLTLAGDSLTKPPYKPWLQLWAWKFDDLIPEALIPLAVRLSTPQWFDWTANLTLLLNTNALQEATALRRTASWSKQLQSTYLPSLTRLLQMLGDNANISWLLIQSTDPAVKILDALAFYPGSNQWILQSLILKTLQGGGENARTVAEQVQKVKTASDRSLRAAVALQRPQQSSALARGEGSFIHSWGYEEWAAGEQGEGEEGNWLEDEQALLKMVRGLLSPEPRS